ncbi:hypothetical protein CIPAW_14G099600 [Carya illinoinensis]|uniref:Uncharacterized protein n=1 Tax=Carya illinoinensis TaxID=32201 RepID=A0A8T1NL84_CARIL|nr:hypothetical protein CIPAW_14G099600 [Carya illinoinensis]
MRNGWSISIWSQTRVPQVPSFKVHSLIRIFGETSKVSKLIVEEWHCWDHKLIFEVFNRSEAINICSIPLSSKRMEDKLIWGYRLYTTDGRFSVKSTYHLGVTTTKERLAAPSTSHDKVIGSTKQFLWRAMKNLLPTKQNLFKRNEPETIQHVLWTCPATSDVWAERTSLLKKWTCVDQYSKKEQLEEIAVICRRLWIRMNRFVFDNNFEAPATLITRALVENNVKWEAPLAAILKLNFDVAMDQEHSKLSIDLIARNHKGEVMFSAFLSGFFTGSSNVKDTIFERDAKSITQAINGNSHDWSSFGMMTVHFIYREGNHATHMLAKKALYMEEDRI